MLSCLPPRLLRRRLRCSVLARIGRWRRLFAHALFPTRFADHNHIVSLKHFCAYWLSASFAKSVFRNHRQIDYFLAHLTALGRARRGTACALCSLIAGFPVHTGAHIQLSKNPASFHCRYTLGSSLVHNSCTCRSFDYLPSFSFAPLRRAGGCSTLSVCLHRLHRQSRHCDFSASGCPVRSWHSPCWIRYCCSNLKISMLFSSALSSRHTWGLYR